MSKNNIKGFIGFCLNHGVFGIIFIVAVMKNMEILAIVCLLLFFAGAKKISAFILGLLAKLEESKKGSFAGISWDTSSLPKESLKLEEESGISIDFYTYFREGTALLQQGQPKMAKPMLEKAKESNPDNFEVNVSLGLVYNILGDNKKSIECSKKALEIRPNSFIPQFNLAVATNHLYGATKSINEYLKAEDMAKEAGMEESVTVGKLNLFLGHDFRDLGDTKEALDRYNRAKNIFELSNTEEARFWLKDTFANINKLKGIL